MDSILYPNSDLTLTRTALMGQVESAQYPYKKWVDPLDPKLLNLLKTDKFETVVWNSTPITTISYRFYGTVSLWYAILAYNGYYHPQEIPNGATVKIPLLNPQSVIRKPKKSKVLDRV